MKIFTSHSAKDKEMLGELKRDLFVCGINCFLAHDDITPGEHDLERIKKEIANCDIFLIIGNKEVKNSIYCNQEIGMAIGREKHIISTFYKDHTPWGFIARQHGIEYTNIAQLFSKLIQEVMFSGKYEPYWKKEKQCLNTLKINGFSVGSFQKADFISLDSIGKYNSKGNPIFWNDYGYYTEFKILEKQKKIGAVKIGYKGQTTDTPLTTVKLPTLFPFLKNEFFSRCFFDNNISDEKKKALYFLLNDIEHSKSAQKYINEDVVEKSLFRDSSEELEEIKQKILNN